MFRVLYNPHASNGHGLEQAENVRGLLEGSPAEFTDMTATDYVSFFSSLPPEDRVIICGGDGTLHRFINDTDGIEFRNDLLYFPCGTGNDFMNDIRDREHSPLPVINRYIKDLPKVMVNGQTRRFLNNVGFGIDGYCTEEGDRRQRLSEKPVNYTMIAIKGLLGAFKPLNAKVTIDGQTYEFKKTWLAPSMKGRYVGGGMMATPGQDRLDPERKVSLLVWHGSGKLRTLVQFPSIFKGTHVKHTDMCFLAKGYDITVEFDRPCPLQIDGETVSGVTSYHVSAK